MSVVPTAVDEKATDTLLYPTNKVVVLEVLAGGKSAVTLKLDPLVRVTVPVPTKTVQVVEPVVASNLALVVLMLVCP